MMAVEVRVVRKKQRIEKIEWDDAVADAGWRTEQDAEKPHRCTSIGPLVMENKQCVVLAGSWGINSSKELETNNRITIPKGFIISRRTVI